MKQKITFIYEYEHSNTPIVGHQGLPRKVSSEITGEVSLPELIEEFEYFIKGIGFYPPENSKLQYVDNDTEEPKLIP